MPEISFMLMMGLLIASEYAIPYAAVSYAAYGLGWISGRAAAINVAAAVSTWASVALINRL